MTDLQKFQELFDNMGVTYRYWPSSDNVPHEASEELKKKHPRMQTVSVTQCHFYFSEQGEYLGSEADEMGYFVERK